MATNPVFSPSNNAARQAKRAASAFGDCMLLSSTATARASVAAVAGNSDCMPAHRLASSGWLAAIATASQRVVALASSRPHSRHISAAIASSHSGVDRTTRFAAREDLRDRLCDVAGPGRQRPHLRVRIEAVVMQRRQVATASRDGRRGRRTASSAASILSSKSRQPARRTQPCVAMHPRRRASLQRCAA